MLNSGETIVLLPKKGGRWKNVKACVGRFKGKLERRFGKSSYMS